MRTFNPKYLEKVASEAFGQAVKVLIGQKTLPKAAEAVAKAAEAFLAKKR